MQKLNKSKLFEDLRKISYYDFQACTKLCFLDIYRNVIIKQKLIKTAKNNWLE